MGKFMRKSLLQEAHAIIDGWGRDEVMTAEQAGVSEGVEEY